MAQHIRPTEPPQPLPSLTLRLHGLLKGVLAYAPEANVYSRELFYRARTDCASDTSHHGFRQPLKRNYLSYY